MPDRWERARLMNVSEYEPELCTSQARHTVGRAEDRSKILIRTFYKMSRASEIPGVSIEIGISCRTTSWDLDEEGYYVGWYKKC